MSEMDKRSTIIDVARLSGVSITTVSRVINGNYPVSEKTKKKVNQAIEELGFRPNLLARSLIHDRSQTIGVLTPSIENLFFSQVIRGIDGFVKDKEYRSFLCNTEGNPNSEVEMIDSLINRSVDGIIVINPRTRNIESGYYEGIAKRIPLVLINGYDEGVNCNMVQNDDKTGTLEALRHLLNQGRKKIAILRGEVSHSYDVKEALYRDFMKQHFHGVNEEHIVVIEGGNGQETVYQAKEAFIRHMKEAKDPCDALLCCNDFMAVGAMNGARACSLRIPEDLSIIGFDNTIISEITDPPMTTVDHHMEELGSTAARLMVDLIEEHKSKTHSSAKKISVTTSLVVRGT